MEYLEFCNERNNVTMNYEESKRKVIEDYTNYMEISKAITKGNTIMEFILEKEKGLRKRWQIQTLYGTKEDGIVLLKSSLGEFYVNRDRKKGKIQYLMMEENGNELIRNEKFLMGEMPMYIPDTPTIYENERSLEKEIEGEILLLTEETHEESDKEQKRQNDLSEFSIDKELEEYKRLGKIIEQYKKTRKEIEKKVKEKIQIFERKW